MATSTEKKKRGGQRKPESVRKSRNLTFRTRGELRSKLQLTATISGRSVSEEIEYRLEQSFSDMPSDFQVRMEKYLICICELLESINGNSRPVARKAA